MKGVKYIGQVFDQSGYAEAARNYALALHQLGVPVTIDAVRHSEGQPDLGSEGEVLASLVDRPIEYDRIVVHATPDTWAYRLREEPPGIAVVGCTVWETSALHPIWTAACNRVDEVWVPSRWNAEVFRASGVATPVEVVPHCIELPDADAAAPLAIDGVPETGVRLLLDLPLERAQEPAGAARRVLRRDDWRSRRRPGDEDLLRAAARGAGRAAAGAQRRRAAQAGSRPSSDG